MKLPTAAAACTRRADSPGSARTKGTTCSMPSGSHATNTTASVKAIVPTVRRNLLNRSVIERGRRSWRHVPSVRATATHYERLTTAGTGAAATQQHTLVAELGAKSRSIRGCRPRRRIRCATACESPAGKKGPIPSLPGRVTKPDLAPVRGGCAHTSEAGVSQPCRRFLCQQHFFLEQLH